MKSIIPNTNGKILLMKEKLELVAYERIFIITSSSLRNYLNDSVRYKKLENNGLIIQSHTKTDDDILLSKAVMEKQVLKVSNDSFIKYQTDPSTSKYLKK